MSEFFLELFSDEIPPKLQIDAKNTIIQILEKSLIKKNITFKTSNSYSTPKRLVFVFGGIPEKIVQKEKILKGPKVGSDQTALDGFISSNYLKKSDIYQDNIQDKKYYFAKIKPKTIDVFSELAVAIPDALKSYSWKNQ